MSMKIVYVLVSNSDDYFLEQTILGAYSVRKYNPEATIEVVVDQDTEKTLADDRARLRDYVSDVITANVPEKYNMMQRSRFLKTNLTEYIDGDFVYMDSDTVISGSLGGIYDGVQSIGVIRDENLEEYSEPVKNWIRGTCERMGWQDMSEEKGYNGGVIIVRRNADSERFFEHWHNNWLECSSKGYDRDQVALTKANKECNYIANEVDGKFNCQIAKFEADKYKEDARILHYYDVNTCLHVFNDLKIWNKFKFKNTIPAEFVSAVENPREVLANRCIRIYEKDICFQKSGWHDIYYEYPMLQSYLLFFCKILCKTWGLARKIKAKIKH